MSAAHRGTTYSTSRGSGPFRSRFADHDYPYLSLIAGLTWLHVPPLLGIEALSIPADVVLVVGFPAWSVV